MLTKIYNMQKFLWLNAEMPFGKGKFGLSELGESKAFGYFSMYLFLCIISSDNDISYFMIAILTAIALAFIIGRYANKNNIIITMIPSSKIFKFLNMYLIGFWILASLCIVMLLCQRFGILLTHAISHVMKSKELLSRYSKTTFEIAILNLIIVTVMYVGLLTVMFIKNNWIRRLTAAAFLVLSAISMNFIGKYMASNVGAKDTGDFLLNFQLMSNRGQLLANWGIEALVIIGVLIFLGYLIYRGRHVRN